MSSSSPPLDVEEVRINLEGLRDGAAAFIDRAILTMQGMLADHEDGSVPAREDLEAVAHEFRQAHRHLKGMPEYIERLTTAKRQGGAS